MKKTRFFGVISTLVLLIAVFAIFANVEERSAKHAEADVDGALYGASGIVVPEVVVNPPTDLVNNSAELSDAIDVVFSNGSSSEYVIVYNSAGSFSSDLSNLFYKNGKSDVLFFKDSDCKESAKEILVGATNRAESATLVAVVNEAASSNENYAWGYKVENGKLVAYASNNASYAFLLDDFAKLFTSDGLSLKEGLCIVRFKNVAEHKAEQDALAEAEKYKQLLERYNKALEGLEAYKGSLLFRTDSNGVVQPGAELMPSDAYPDPEQYPTYGEHPRVHVNTETLPRLREVFNNPPEELAHLVVKVKEYADYDFNGVFPAIPGKNYTYQEKYFKYMEAKAFMYLMTGDEMYGYEAILCAKNCILTMVYTDQIFKDTYRGGHHAISIITEIYDWCYDLMTEEDKTQIIDGARFYLFNTLEFTYPPSNMGYISGHGMSYQFLHSYVGFSLAIYDERPDWWDFVGGRFYSQYCLGINYCVQSGYYSQGTTCYAPGKLYNIYISSWMVESATGHYPFNDGLRDVPYFMLSQVMPNNKYFEYGDTPTSGTGASVGSSWMIIAVGMYNDPTVYAAAKKFSNNFNSISENTFGDRISAPNALVFLAGCAGSTEQFAENLPLIEYTGTPAGITVARTSWTNNAVAVFMKVGELNMANHDHRDSGTFQIYYKGLLAPANDGEYAVYGSNHWKYYHQATISDNGLLVFDPDLYEEPDVTPLLDSSGKPIVDNYGNPMYEVRNPAKAFYTGSQRAIGEAGSFDTLLSSQHNFGTIVGHAEGYKQDGSAKFAYIAGDITNAYTSGSASFVGRSMLTVFTDDPDYPMYFFVYDNVAPVSGDDDVTMKFLLHSVTEPIVDGSSVIIENGDGQLVLLNTTGNEIETIGGNGKKYWVNGINIYEDVASGGLSTGSQKTYESTKLWGRTEVSAAVGETGNQMLNVMYVADKGQREMLSASSIVSGALTGTIIGNVAVFFADTSVELFSSEASVTVENDAEIVEYYFCGLDTGTWKVFLGEGENKQFVGTTYSSDATHMVSFKAPTGAITLEPGDDIKPSNSGRIFYQNVSSAFEGPKYFSYDGVTALPTQVKDGSSQFLGWYLDAAFTQPITEIDGSLFKGNVTVFAKFKFMYANEDFSWAKEEPLHKSTFNKNGISYSSVEDKTANYESGYEKGHGYIIWSGTTGGPVISVSDANNSIANSEYNKFTYTFSLARNGSDPLLATNGRIVSRSGKKNNILSLFSTSTNGNLNVCGKTIALTNELYTFSIEVDFESGKLTAYDEFGELIGQSNMNLVETATTFAESKAFFVENILNWRNGGGGGKTATIKIGQITIEAGGFLTNPDECAHKDTNDDGICDRCKSEFSDGCEHYDANDDGKCDKCNTEFDDGCEHKDTDDNGKCDKCDADYDDGCEICYDKNDDGKCDRCMKVCDDGCDNHRDADDDGKCDIVGCGKEYTDGCDHFDKNDDGKCDKCEVEHEDGCENCRDKNDDLKCDRCGEDFDDGEELPDGQWRIIYVLPDGASLPENAPTVHTTGSVTQLPKKLTVSEKIFGGWYLDEALTQPISEIPADRAAPVMLYAKLNSYFIHEDFSWAETSPVDNNKSFSKNGVTYPADTSIKSYYVDGKGYLVWTTLGAENGPVIGGNPYSPTTASEITYSFSLAAVEGEDMIVSELRLVGKNSPSNSILFSLFSTSKDGTLTILGSYKTVLSSDEFFSFNVTVDYVNGILTATDEAGATLATKKLGNPVESDTCDEWNEWKNNLTGIMNWRNSNPVGAAGAMKIGYIAVHEGGVFVDPESCGHRDADDDGSCDICKTEFSDGCNHVDKDDDGVCDKEGCGEGFTDGCDNHRDANDDGVCDKEGCGAEYDDGEEIPEGTYKINYVLPEGVTLPVDAPKKHTKGNRTVLLSKFDREGYVFVGWYLDEACTEPVDYFDKTYEGEITVYPKWNKVIIDEDYSFAETEQIDKTTFAKNGITYQEDVNYKTYFEDGKGYVVWTAASGKGSVLLANIQKTNSNKLTYTFSFAKAENYDLLNISFRLIGRDPDATANKELATFFTLSGGKLNLCGKSYEITEEFFTFSITIDFESATYYSYDEDGKLLATAGMPSAPVSNSIDTWLEWKDLLTVGFNARNQNTTGTDQALKIGYIGITEGTYGEKYVQNIPSELPDGAYRINYQLNGGTLPEGAPDRFMAGTATLLPETVYYNDPSVKFVGWYADSTFTEPITEIPADAAASDFTVYAKTVKALYLIDVNFIDDKTTGTVVANRYCVHEGGDTDADGICNTCGFCAGHTDTASDGVCDVCGYKIAKCSTHSDVHTKDGAGKLVEENVADKYCDICGRCPTSGKTFDSGKLGNSFALQDCDQPYGYATIVDNGDDDYLHIEGNYSGTLIQLSGAPEVKTVLATSSEKAITFRMVYGCYGDTLVGLTTRMTFRKADDSGNVAETLIVLGTSNGQLVLKSRGGAVLATFDYGTLIDVSFVVDFDNRQIRYYLGDSQEPVLTEAFALEYTRGLNILNSRLTGTGSVDIAATEIYIGDMYN